MKGKIVIIDYHMGNLRSIYNKFVKIGVNCLVTNDKKEILESDKLVLPGVGHFKKAMENLNELGLIDILNKKVLEDKTPILGICLGVQLFCKKSEEGNVNGLGWIDAEVVRFKVSNTSRYKVPHMGWNNVSVINSNCIDKVIKKDDQFYFVHSYHLKCNDPSIVWMITNYDYEFVSAIHKNNIFGVQFHPEKSHDAGYALLKKFADL